MAKHLNLINQLEVNRYELSMDEPSGVHPVDRKKIMDIKPERVPSGLDRFLRRALKQVDKGTLNHDI